MPGRRSAIDPHFATGRRHKTKADLAKLCLARANQSGQADNLTFTNVYGYSVYGWPGDIVEFKGDVQRPVFDDREGCADLATGHKGYDLVIADFTDAASAHQFAIPQHRYDIANATDLLNAVCDVDDGQSFRSQQRNRLEELLGLFLCQGCGRLIQNKHPCRRLQRPCNLDDLPLCSAEVAHHSVGVDFCTRPAQGGQGAKPCFAAAQEAPFCRLSPAMPDAIASRGLDRTRSRPDIFI